MEWALLAVPAISNEAPQPQTRPRNLVPTRPRRALQLRLNARHIIREHAQLRGQLACGASGSGNQRFRQPTVRETAGGEPHQLTSSRRSSGKVGSLSRVNWLPHDLMRQVCMASLARSSAVIKEHAPAIGLLFTLCAAAAVSKPPWPYRPVWVAALPNCK